LILPSIGRREQGDFRLTVSETRPRYDLPVLLILALGMALRFIGLNQQSFWVDEIRSVRMALGGPEHSWAYAALDIHGPLHLVLLKIWMMLVGSGEGATRALSAIFGAVALPLFYSMAVPLVGRSAALVSLALLAVSPFHLWYSQETRNYALFFDVALLAVPAYLREIEQRSRRSFLTALGLSLVACLTNLTGVLLLAIYGLLAVVVGRKTRYPLWRPLLLAAPLAVLLSPWLLGMLGMMGSVHFRHARETPGNVVIVSGEGPFGLLNLPFSFQVFTLGFTMGPSVTELREQRWTALLPSLPYLVPILGVFAATALWGLKALWHRWETRLALIVWALTPVLLVSLLSQLNLKGGNPRYGIAACSSYLLLLGCGVMAIRRPVLRAAVLSGLLLVSMYSDFRYFTEHQYWRPDGRSVGRTLRAESRPSDVLISCGTPEPMEYYAPAGLTVRRPPSKRSYASRETMVEWLRKTCEGKERLWYLRISDWDDPGSGILIACKEIMAQEGEWRFEKAPLYLFAVPPEWSRPSEPRP
jgi:hypothetical protein